MHNLKKKCAALILKQLFILQYLGRNNKSASSPSRPESLLLDTGGVSFLWTFFFTAYLSFLVTCVSDSGTSK